MPHGALGFREIHVEAWAGDVMAGAGGAVGPTPDIQQQPAGDVPHDVPEQPSYTLSNSTNYQR